MCLVVPTAENSPTRHAVVSGASGFIGRHLCRHLQRHDIEVTAVHRNSQTGPWDHELLLDLSAEEAIALPGAADTVFHLAGFAHADHDASADALHQAVTVRGTARLLDACTSSVRRFVYFSSVKAMGESTGKSCVDETCVPSPTTSYGRARLMAEQLAF